MLYGDDIKKFSRLEGSHNNIDSWDSVLREIQKPPPSVIGQATETYLEPAAKRLEDTPDVNNMETDGVVEASRAIAEEGVDMTKVTESCIRYMKDDIHIVKNAGLNLSDVNTSWQRTIEIASMSMLEEYERTHPNSISREEIKIASINAGKFYSNNNLYKTASWWTAPFRWIGTAAKTVGKLLARSIAKLIPFVGIVASVYFAFDAWKKWRQEINFIFTDLNARKYGLDNWDTWFVSRMAGKINTSVEENKNISLSLNDLPFCSSDTDNPCYWYFTPEAPESVSPSNLWGDIKGAFTGDERPEPNFEESSGAQKSFGNVTGNPDTYKELAALNVSCEAIMDNAYLLIENILTGIVSTWAVIGEFVGIATFGLGSMAIAAIDAVVSAALMTGSWARRKTLRKAFTENRSKVIGIYQENNRRISYLLVQDSITERDARQDSVPPEDTPEDIIPTAPTGDAPDISTIPTITRVVKTVAPALKAI